GLLSGLRGRIGPAHRPPARALLGGDGPHELGHYRHPTGRAPRVGRGRLVVPRPDGAYRARARVGNPEHDRGQLMRNRPTGDELLTCARKVVRDEVLTALPADKRHAVLMVMNAMSIAERQLRYGEAPEREELAAIRRLLGEDFSDLAVGNRRLCDVIREGR